MPDRSGLEVLFGAIAVKLLHWDWARGMSKSLATYRDQAQQAFLGKDSVLGVGIVLDSEEKLVFLLEQSSGEVEEEIRSWASRRSVPIVFEVTGTLHIR